MIRNQEVATVLDAIAELLEAKGESPFRIGAYRRAARRVGSLPENVEAVWKEGQLEEIPGVGESIAAKIDEFLRTGRLRYLEDLRREVAPGLATLLLIPGLGTKRARLIYERLGVQSVSDLGRAAREHRLCGLPRFGERLEAKLLREVERLEHRTQRLLLGVALPTAEEVVSLLLADPTVLRAEPAGSIRRMRDTIGDIDILAAAHEPADAVNAFCRLPLVREVLAAGPTKASVLVAGDLQVDLRAIPPDTFGAALQYFTGSKEHNIALRELALRRGLKLSEYGLFEEATGRRLVSTSEEDVYKALGLPWITPELRENRGEIEAALAGRLPTLFEMHDLRGDLHVHTDWSDGADSLEAMVEAARTRGYEYVAITDHSQGLGIAHGLTVERLQEQRRQIDVLNHRLAPFRVLHGIEVNIRRNGRLDYPDTVMGMFDLVTASVHGTFELPRDQMTQRILAAIRNPYVDVFNHPRGRLLGKRDEYDVDLDVVISAARENGVALEINSQPERLDLDDIWARRAKDGGVLLAIDTDAHATSQLGLIRYGVATARRGWVEKQHVLNARPLSELLARLSRHRAAA